MTTPPSFRAGERWTYGTAPGFEQSRIVIGAVVTFTDREPVISCAVTEVPRRCPDGHIETATIPFLPMAASALAASVVGLDGYADLPADFAAAFESWQNDPRGLSVFTVPFEGSVETLIAKQMADIVGVAA